LKANRFKAMFGEYALYLDGRVVALVCRDTLFVKPTEGALALLPNCKQGPPYPGAKAHLVIGNRLGDADLMARLFQQVAEDIPAPTTKQIRHIAG
jgi:TfoX/Sxy family transcriptional regulator of competence genes